MEKTTHARRYAKACDACHKKKIRCMYSDGGCELCRKTGQSCKFTRIEKALPKRPRRGKYLAALEERMKTMEEALQQSKRDQSEQDDAQDEATSEEANGTQNGDGLHLPPKEAAMRLAQGYFASSNHLFPIFGKESFMHRMKAEYPPNRIRDLVWWSTVVTVLCYAHRLRAMSSPVHAESENHEASRYLKEALDVAPKLTYAKSTMGSAQVLLGIASILRGTAMPDSAPMLVAVAIRMLQDLDMHKEEEADSSWFLVRKERERTFWVAYVLDKDIALQARKPPVLHQRDIGRLPLKERENDGIGIVRSLDSFSEVNLFAISQRLAAIQEQVWNRIHSAGSIVDRNMLEAAQNELNPVLAAWKNDLPFQFRAEELVGRWPKHAILHIVVLHFRYFHTLVELNKEPPMAKDDMSPLNGDCPVARSLPSYPHSTAMLAVDAARDALDLAALTPRGNFQNVWMFFHFSISAVLTLLVNAIVRPLNDQAAADLHRVDTWLQVIDILATSSERPDLLQKKEFLTHMKIWALHVMHDALVGTDTAVKNLPCLQQLSSMLADNNTTALQLPGETDMDIQWLELGNVQPDVFPLDLLHVDHNPLHGVANWPANIGINW